MQLRPLGDSGLAIAPVVLGGNVFGWTADRATTFRLLDAFVDAGFNLVDSADVYPRWAPGCTGLESETLIGQWLRQGGRRERIAIATKSGKGAHNPGLSPASLRQAVDDALGRLRTDFIDLFQVHAFDPDVPQADTLGTLGELMAAGKIRAIGASNFSAEQLRAALVISRRHGLVRYECLQPHYNLAERAGYEAELEPLVRAEGIGVLPYFALASGFLSGKYRRAEQLPANRRAEWVGKYLNPEGMRLLDALDRVAARHRARPVQVALAWLQARPGITAPIASATSVHQLHELLASSAVPLDADDLAQLDQAGPAPSV